MNREQIKAMALTNGFKLKQQPDGTEDLNPYVYEFAAALTEHMQQQNDYLSALASGQPLYGLEEKIADLMARNKALKGEVERLQALHDDLQIENARLEQTYGDDYAALDEERNQLKAAVALAIETFHQYEMDVETYPTVKHIAMMRDLNGVLVKHDAEVIEREFSALADNFACFPEREIGGYWASVETRNYGHNRANQLRQQTKEVQHEP